MKALKIAKSPDDALREILLFLLEEKKVGGVFALSKVERDNYAYTLISSKELLNRISPTFPLMPVNAGKMISRLTVVEPAGFPIAVVLRPCELRALFELVKLEQADLENLLLISFTCSGVFPIQAMKDDIDGRFAEYLETTKTGEDFDGLRECCRVCEHFVPDNADVVLMLAGSGHDEESSLLIKTVRGEEFLDGISGEFVEEKVESEKLRMIRNGREAERKRVFAELGTESFGIDGLAKVFGRCISCHACSKACPICYCALCYFEAAENDSDPAALEADSRNRGASRLPSNTVFYHVGRLIHVGMSCVGCGMCSDVCPTEIPVGTIFTKISQSVQKLFEYVPGADLEEEIPIFTFQEKELEDLGE